MLCFVNCDKKRYSSEIVLKTTSRHSEQVIFENVLKLYGVRRISRIYKSFGDSSPINLLSGSE